MKGSVVRYLRSIRRESCLALALILLAPVMSYAAPTRQILIIHSYSQEYPWTRGQHEGFMNTLETEAQMEFLVSTEYLDTKRRVYDETYASEMARHLRFKYADYNFAAIYLTDDNALLFVRDHLSRVFPGVPVFFSGVNDYGVRSSLNPALFTGVFERKEFAPNIEWLLRVDKNANDLLFVGDGSNTYRAIETELRRELVPYRIRVTFLAEKRLELLLARLRGLPGKYVFLTTLVGITDENDQVLPLREILKGIVGTGRIVIGMEDVYITENVLGGFVTDGRNQGMNAARLLLAQQHGKPMIELAPILKSPNSFIFDDRSLQEHGIDLPSHLRSQAVILNPRPGYYEQYGSLIVGVLVVLVVSLLSVVTGSTVFLSRKNRALGLAQSSAESANTLFNRLAEQTRTVHWEVDADGLYTYVSDISEAVIGYRPEEIMGKKRFYDLRPAEEGEAFKTMVFDSFARGKVVTDLENILQTRDGRPVWVSTNVIPSLDSNGNLAGFRGSDTDITDRKRAAVALQESEGRLRDILDSTDDGILAVDASGKAIFSNRRFVELWRIPQSVVDTADDNAMLDVVLEQLVDPDGFLRKVKRLYGTADIDTDIIHFKDGRLFERFSMPMMGDGSVVGRLWSFRDITKRKQAEEEKRSLEERLNRMEKMESLGVLAGGVAHDLNNVMGVIIGYSELLLLREDKSGANRPSIEAIMKGCQRATAIVQDLLTLARRGVSVRDVVNLNRIVAEFQKLPEFQGLSSFHPSVRFKFDLESDLPNISGSTVHLGKTLFNLCSNGCEAMPKGGVLTIRTVREYLDKPINGYDEVQKGEYVVLSVSDTGEGIPEAYLKRIFEPFYTKKVMGRSGTGLGLTVVWGTVRDHDGYIDVRSEEGKGSTFTLYIPATREEITAEHDPVPLSEYMGKGESILIADDVKEQRDLATGILRKLNYTVSCVSCGEEALAYLKDHPCDLLILDMIMDPGMDGLDTFKGVLELHPEQKAIIVSGFSESDRVRAAQVLGAGAYVRKPYLIEKLARAVRKELDRIKQ